MLKRGSRRSCCSIQATGRLYNVNGAVFSYKNGPSGAYGSGKWDPGGRWFKSGHPDQLKSPAIVRYFPLNKKGGAVARSPFLRSYAYGVTARGGW